MPDVQRKAVKFNLSLTPEDTDTYFLKKGLPL